MALDIRFICNEGTCSVVIRLFARLSLLIFIALWLAGCPDKEGSLPVSDPAEFFQAPAPLPPISYTAVDEPFVGYVRASDSLEDADGNPLPDNQLFEDRGGVALALLNYDPNLPVDDALALNGDNPSIAVTADTGLMVALNTEDDDERRTEYTAFSNQDTVFVVTHLSGEVRALRHFGNTVCEIIPAQRVVAETDAGGDVRYTVINARWVYVKTSAGECNGAGSEYSDTIIRYYKIPLNYKENANKIELCEGEPIGDEFGVNTDENSCKTRLFSFVLESEARAEIVFGWDLDETTLVSTDYYLAYGFLGYGIAEKRLSFFDSEREQKWSQSRGIERVDVSNQDDVPYIASIAHLEDFNYLLQMGRDIFVLNSAQDLFSKSFLEVDKILVDRTYRMDASFDGSVEMLRPLSYTFNRDDVLMNDHSKLIRYDYAARSFEPAAADLPRAYSVVFEDALQPLGAFETQVPFSQFNIQSCQDEGRFEPTLSQVERDVLIDDCVNAHDVEDAQLPSPGAPWQFVIDCNASASCVESVDHTDYCVTPAELIADPSLVDLNDPCLPSDYTHLNELDDSANNAAVIGYMQYGENHVNDLVLSLDGDTLFMVAKMKEKELLLRYKYLEPLTGPTADREQVMLGRRHQHFGLRAQSSDGGIFITTLRHSATRFNECYKNHQRVTCDLANEFEEGSVSNCTAVDVDLGSCTTQFKEYVSYPLFCSNAQIAVGACTEECTQQQIDDGFCAVGCSASDISSGDCPVVLQPVFHLMADRVNAPFGRWLPATDYSAGELENTMYLLSSSDVLDEGILNVPALWEVDSLTGALDVAALLSIDAEVEDALPARIDSVDRAWLDLVQRDVIQVGGVGQGGSVSSALQVFLENPKQASPSAEPLAEFQYLLPGQD